MKKCRVGNKEEEEKRLVAGKATTATRLRTPLLRV